jgi:cytochrome c biogenesis protein CcmG, thiol:disulfide interchange protein DsbE
MSVQKRSRIPLLWLLFPLLGIIIAVSLVIESPGNPGSNDLAGSPGATSVTFGQPAPDFSATTLDGKQVRLSDLKGSTVAISFWASWCIPCKTELPELQKASTRYSNKQLIILAVNAGEPESIVRAFISDFNISFPVLLDQDKTITSQYHVSPLPITFWVGANGVLKAEQIGPLDQELIDRYMASLVEQP